MIILKPGGNYFLPNFIFDCQRCGCQWIANEKEYSSHGGYKISTCPNCSAACISFTEITEEELTKIMEEQREKSVNLEEGCKM